MKKFYYDKDTNSILVSEKEINNNQLELNNIVAIPLSLLVNKKNIFLNESNSPVIKCGIYDFIITNKTKIGGNKYIAKFDIVYNTINDRTVISIKDHNKCMLPIKFNK